MTAAMSRVRRRHLDGSSVTVDIDVTSIDTGSAPRDEHIR